MIRHILVVCTGNICRSPVAEALLRQRLAEGGFVVASAGTAAMVGWPADPMTQRVAAGYGLSLSEHRARQLGPAMLADHDLVLTLDQSHSDWIGRRHPQFRGRTHKLLKWRDNGDVEDPYGQPQAVFDRVHRDIALGVDDWLKKLK
ncbi:MAG: low molecular weight phosphotyrosine protein phosphatase [Nevskiaceae bacterium]|nr:MAG: low molecular weight phosphotyrosine protein phosphatase [Nevskiaceae bacterium]